MVHSRRGPVPPAIGHHRSPSPSSLGSCSPVGYSVQTTARPSSQALPPLAPAPAPSPSKRSTDTCTTSVFAQRLFDPSSLPLDPLTRVNEHRPRNKALGERTMGQPRASVVPLAQCRSRRPSALQSWLSIHTMFVPKGFPRGPGGLPRQRAGRGGEGRRGRLWRVLLAYHGATCYAVRQFT